MSSPDTETSQNFPPVPCEEIVFRASGKKKDINEDTGKFVPQVFMRIRNKDEDGLSVYLGEIDRADQVHQNYNAKAIGTLHVGSIREMESEDVRLDVRQDDTRHGVIEGLPFSDENPALAEL